MPTKIERWELPGRRGASLELERFATEAVDEFLSGAGVGDCMEVTGFPQVCGDDPDHASEQVAKAIRYRCAHGGDTEDEVKVWRRQGRAVLAVHAQGWGRSG